MLLAEKKEHAFVFSLSLNIFILKQRYFIVILFYDNVINIFSCHFSIAYLIIQLSYLMHVRVLQYVKVESLSSKKLFFAEITLWFV